MAYPTGSGSERIQRGRMENQANDVTAFYFNGAHPVVGEETHTVPANHIITMISIIICETAAAGNNVTMWALADANYCAFMNARRIASKETFIWNDRFVLHGGDKLIIQTTSGAAMDIYYTYIDQDWT